MATWNTGFEALPTAGETPSYGDNRIRELKTAIRERIEKEHYMDISSGAVQNHGHHRMGSAVCYYQAAEPTVRPDGLTALGAQDNGRLWIRSTDFRLYVYIHGTGWYGLTVLYNNDNAFSGNNTFSGANSFSGGNTFSGNNTLSGTNAFTGINNFSNIRIPTSQPVTLANGCIWLA